MINSNQYHYGRFGNLFFTGMALHFISKMNDLHSTYKDYQSFVQLGLTFYCGSTSYQETISLTDENFFTLVEKPIYKNISIRNNVWCQTTEFANYIEQYLNEPIQKGIIMDMNPFHNRYGNNNDVCIHVRLGDIFHREFNQPFEYYDKVLQDLSFDHGYICSDSISNEICTRLIEKYKLSVVSYDIVPTIQFASTCKYIVLSSGTFSWMIGALSFMSFIYYPLIKKKWHGTIFVNPAWKEIDY